MKRDFAETAALEIMNTKLRGKSREAVYELSDAELSVLSAALNHWTIGMSQILADRIGLKKAARIIKHVLALPEDKRIALAHSASDALDTGEIPDEADFAAYILSNHSDELTINEEIKRRESLQ